MKNRNNSNNINSITTNKVGSGGNVAPVLFFEYAGAFFTHK